MNNRPKRRRYKDNPYHLEYIQTVKKYYVVFYDAKNNLKKINISQELFNTLDRFELDDLKELNEYDRHIEHSEIYEENLNLRAVSKPLSIDAIVEKKIENQNLYNAIENLPSIQKRRLKLYYFEEKTLREIAKLENCNYTAIKFSIDIALRNLKEQLNKKN